MTRRLVAIVPAWNEAGSITRVVEEIETVDPGIAVVVVDDPLAEAAPDGAIAAALLRAIGAVAAGSGSPGFGPGRGLRPVRGASVVVPGGQGVLVLGRWLGRVPAAGRGPRAVAGRRR